MKENSEDISKKTSLLFVCLGNICRSPAAEGIMRHITKEHMMEDYVDIDSAGIGSWHAGELPDRRMRSHGSAHGYGGHRGFELVIELLEDGCKELLKQIAQKHGVAYLL